MAEIKVKVLDKNTLEILEEAKPGDRIDLSSITRVDLDFVNNLIALEKNNIVTQRLSEKEAEHKREIQELKNRYEMNEENALLKKETAYKEEISRLNAQFKAQLQETNSEILRIKAEFKTLQATADSDKKAAIAEQAEKLRAEYNKQIQELQNKINEYTNKLDSEIKMKQTELENQKLSLERDFSKTIGDLKDEKAKVEIELDNLKLQKSFQSVKMIGESLEKWCNEEFESAQLSGFEDCTWEKDNTVVVDQYDRNDSGSKADYIFKMYSGSEHIDANEITSVCLEMKSESPNSTNKKTNEYYLKKLNINRNKKNCEYALLVSELEWTEDNDAPIRKIPGYDKMYMVRPQYMITFLSIVYSLGKRYKDLINSIKENDEELKEIIDINNEFEHFKEIYVVNPINALDKQLQSMNKNAAKIIDAANEIHNEIDLIISKTITNILTKIETFTIKQEKLNRKIAKIEK